VLIASSTVSALDYANQAQVCPKSVVYVLLQNGRWSVSTSLSPVCIWALQDFVWLWKESPWRYKPQVPMPHLWLPILQCCVTPWTHSPMIPAQHLQRNKAYTIMGCLLLRVLCPETIRLNNKRCWQDRSPIYWNCVSSWGTEAAPVLKALSMGTGLRTDTIKNCTVFKFHKPGTEFHSNVLSLPPCCIPSKWSLFTKLG
jgi:hypothetical protein